MATAIARIVKNGAALVTFAFRGSAVTLEFRGGEMVVECPVCARECRVNPLTHQVIANLSTGKALTIYPSLSCPNGACGWRVLVTRAIAFEVGEEMPPKPQAVTTNIGVSVSDDGTVTCSRCWGEFKPGAARQTKCRRCQALTTTQPKANAPWRGAKRR